MRETIIESILCEQTGDSCTLIHHKSGLDIYVCEMPGFHTTEALFGTKYGSINTQFKTAQEPDFCTVPEGIAHFLEHKLFENEDSDVFALYAKTGAEGNAFTSFDKTCYLFRCSDHYLDSLEILLSFVQSPYFTPENVAKEQGIIGQEIRMCDDDPGWRVFFHMLQGLYHNHPVKIDIAGTVESIAEITDQLLYRCYHTFYNLHNMVLSIAGNCKVEEILPLADRLLKPCEDIQLETVFPEEPASIVQSEIVDQAPIGVPLFHLGIKCAPKNGMESVHAELAAYFVIQILTDSGSPLYQSMMQEQLINNTFSGEVFNGDGYFPILFEGESTKPRTLREKIMEAIETAQRDGLDPERFEEVKKSTYGSMVRELNSVSAVANAMLNAHMNGITPYAVLSVLSQFTLEEANRYLREEVHPANSTLSMMESCAR